MLGSRRAALGLVVIGAVAIGCGQRSDDAGATPHGLHGAELPQPRPKPDFTLTNTEGKPYDFRRATDGYLTFLFFGYTHCPDICPLHMANLATVLKNVPVRTRDRVKVVFVTTDPARDTGPVIRDWLDHFDETFVGLTGTEEEVVQAQRAAGLQPGFREDSTAEYTVAHAAYVIAYTPDNLQRVLYPSGMRQRDWAADIPILASRWPAK